MSSDAAQDLYDHYTTEAGRIRHEAERWLRQLIQDRLASYTLDELKRAVTTALRDLRRAERHRLTLSQILNPDALRCYVGKPTTPRSPTTNAPERVYLRVPFDEKEAAKAAGARWDAERKRWYGLRDDAAAIAKLHAWIPDPTGNTKNAAGPKDPKKAARKAAAAQAEREGHTRGTKEHERREQQLYEIWLISQQRLR